MQENTHHYLNDYDLHQWIIWTAQTRSQDQVSLFSGIDLNVVSIWLLL